MTSDITDIFPLGNMRPVKIEEEMRTSYLDYAMSVIVSRALPDIRDGLKPVQRRILFAMHDMGMTPGSAVQEERTRRRRGPRQVPPARRRPRLRGDGAPRAGVHHALPARRRPGQLRLDRRRPAGRHALHRGAPLARSPTELLADIDKNTVDFYPNFDDTLTQPWVLPARLPNLLRTAPSGIAVGMATNIPPHNLGELCDAIALLIDNPDATMEELTEIVHGPDFPTGGVIFRYETVRKPATDGQGPTSEQRDAIRTAYADGQGRVVIRARVHVEEKAKGNRNQIIVTELPYQTNKATLIEKIADLARAKKIDGISDLRDESDRHGMRIVIELKREAQPRQVLNSLYKHTAMQSAFAVNMLALVDRQPRVVSLKKILESYIDHRREVIRRRSEFDLEKAQGPRARPRRPAQGDRHARRGHPDDPRRRLRRRSEDEADGRALRPQRPPGAGRARHAAPPAGRARAEEDRGRVRASCIKPDQLPRRPARQPAQDRPPDQRRRHRAQEEVRRRAPHADHGPGAGGLLRRGHDRPPGDRRHAVLARLHQAPAARAPTAPSGAAASASSA